MLFNCYFVSEDGVNKGIPLSAYESIIVKDFKDSMVTTASILKIPVFKSEKDPSTNKYICFIEPNNTKKPHKEKVSTSGVILGFNSSMWNLAFNENTYNIEVLDPCSPSGNLILFVPTINKPIVLSDIYNPNFYIKINDNKEPELCNIARSDMLLSALSI